MPGYFDKGNLGDTTPLSDQARRGRNRDVAARGDLAQIRTPPPASRPGLPCQTTTIAAYPTTAQAWYAVKAHSPEGTPAEGGPVAFALAAKPFLAANLGSAIPPDGTTVIVSDLDGYPVFTFNG